MPFQIEYCLDDYVIQMLNFLFNIDYLLLIEVWTLECDTTWNN